MTMILTNTMTRKSHGGFINFVNNGAVSWKSGLQSIVTLSSCEAEYVALCSEVCEVKYFRALMRELGHKQQESTLIWEDNKAAILAPFWQFWSPFGPRGLSRGRGEPPGVRGINMSPWRGLAAPFKPDLIFRPGPLPGQIRVPKTSNRG